MKTKLLIVSLLFCSSGYSQGKFFGGNGDGFASAALGNIVLPLQVIDFSVTKYGNDVKAILKISADEEVCKIVLEKSEDAISYTEADKIDNGSTPIQSRDFIFTDQLTSQRTIYYRAKIIKCTGGTQYSKTVFVKNDGSLNQFYYSSASRALQYNVKQAGVLQLINSSGQILYKTVLVAGSGSLNLPVAGAGIYLLRFSNDKAIRIFVR